MPRSKGTTKQRGYSGTHPKFRSQWEPLVAAGAAYCHAAVCLMPSRWIAPGSPWDLGHTPDRSAWTGPEHRKCNRSEAGTRGNRMRGMAKQANRQARVRTIAASSAPLRTSRDW